MGAMHYYLCRFGDPGWPAGGEDLPEWTSIELEPSGYAILASPKRYDGLRRYYLGDDALNPSPVVHRKMAHAFKMNLSSKSLGKILLELLLNGEEGGRRWRQLQPSGNRYEVWLGNELVATMPCLCGGMGSDCDQSALLPTIPFTDDFTAKTSSEYPLGSPYEATFLSGGLAFELLDFPAAAPVSFVIRATNASPATQASAIDIRSYACNHSASATVAAPTTTTVQTLAAGHGVMVRAKRGANAASLILDGDPVYGGYYYFGEDPTSGTYEARMSLTTEATSIPGDGTYEHYVLARQSGGIGRLVNGTDIEVSAVGSTIAGSGQGLFGAFSHSVTNTRLRWGHPGFFGGGRNGILSPDPDYTSYFSAFTTTGRLDPSDPEFLDP